MTIAVDWDLKQQTKQTNNFNRSSMLATKIPDLAVIKDSHFKPDLYIKAAIFLAHHNKISKILPWDRKSYLTQTILPRLSRKGYIFWLYWNSCIWSSSDVIVMFK